MEQTESFMGFQDSLILPLSNKNIPLCLLLKLAYLKRSMLCWFRLLINLNFMTWITFFFLCQNLGYQIWTAQPLDSSIEKIYCHLVNTDSIWLMILIMEPILHGHDSCKMNKSCDKPDLIILFCSSYSANHQRHFPRN